MESKEARIDTQDEEHGSGAEVGSTKSHTRWWHFVWHKLTKSNALEENGVQPVSEYHRTSHAAPLFTLWFTLSLNLIT